MDDVYFPVTVREFAARVYFRDIREETINIGAFEVKSILLNHPGACLGYRVNYNGYSVCYVTDNELYPADNAYYNAEYNEGLVEFIRDADILITDCTYLDEEYPDKMAGDTPALAKWRTWLTPPTCARSTCSITIPPRTTRRLTVSWLKPSGIWQT